MPNSNSAANLKDLMNAMVKRLDHAYPSVVQDIPESRYWDMIDAYILIDPVLAQLYRQYAQAKEQLAQLSIQNGTDDPMTEIAWDMHDSTRCAVETRLIEVRQDKDMTQRAHKIKQHLGAKAQNTVANQTTYPRRPASAQQLHETMVFMMMASLSMNNQHRRQHVSQHFQRAS